MALTAQEMQARVGMRPTLLIGLGGTGQKVLVQLKARMIRNYREIPPAVEFLCFDTDQTVEQTQLDGKVIRLTADTELVNIGGIETPSIIRNLDQYPRIASWITEDKEKIPMRAIVMGAQQVRPLGRMSFFWRVQEIEQKMRAAVNRLTDIKLGTEQRGINVFVISSVCGGTGSGAIVDVAYLIRNVIQRAGLAASFCYVNGILALPSVFPNVEKNGIESNAYATLRELDYFMENGNWELDYGNPKVPTVKFEGQRPFNICYLVDARNERGQGLAGLEDVAPMLAEAIYLQISSQVGAANNSVFDNVRVLALRTENKEEGRLKATAYSSLGTASLVFPAEKIIELCAHRLGADLTQKELLARRASDDEVNAAVNNFLQANQLDTENLLQVLARDSKGNILRVALQSQVLDKFRDSEVFGATQKYLSNAESTLDNDYAQVLDTNRKALTDKLTKMLDVEVNRMVDDPTQGTQFALCFLEKLDATLRNTRAGLDKSQAEMAQRRDRAQQQCRQTLQAYSDSFRANFLVRKGQIKDARQRHVEMFGNYLASRLEIRKREMGIAMLAAVSSTIQARRGSLQQLVDRLGFVQSQLAAFAERLASGKSRTDLVLATDITTNADVERYYTEHFQRLGAAPATALLEAKGPLHDWINLEQAEVMERILQYARTAFADISQITIENVILEKREAVDQDKRLSDLVNRSVPFWMFLREGVLQQGWESQQFVVIGVQDREQSIYKNSTSADQLLVSTFDPHNITVLQTKHGVPLFALTQYRDFKAAHDHIMKTGTKPLYVFPEVRPGGEKAKQVFALGLVYGFIFKSGSFYHVLPADPAYQPTQLAQGMGEALRMFRNNDELIGRVASGVEAIIAADGRAAAQQKLEEYVREPWVCELKGGAAKSNVSPAAMTKDTAAGKPGGQNRELILELREALMDYLKKVLLA